MSIDHNARIDAHDLLARFCHAIDRGCEQDCSELFAHDATIECVEDGALTGRTQIAALPTLIRRSGEGLTRHLITSIVVDRGATWRELVVKAYGPILDLRQGGAISGFYDYTFHLLYVVHRWQIRSIRAAKVGSGAPDLGAAMRENPIGQSQESVH
jgi:hypothetical protein